MISNVQIADAFEEMADLLELSGENAFRVRAYRNGAKAIRDHGDSIAEMILAGTDITTIDGIGETLAEKSEVLVRTGNLPQLEKLRLKVPPSLRQVMMIPGVGAKKAMRLFQELNVTDLATLRQVCESGAVAELKGFGVKTQEGILQNIGIAEKAALRLGIDAADAMVQRLREHMLGAPEVEKLDFAGSYRRGKETVGDLDMLVVSTNKDAVMNRFADFVEIVEVLQRGETKMSVRVADAFQVDMRVVPEQSWGAALQYFTGSKEHNVRVRSIAKSQGMKINEYGVFDAADETRVIAGSEEADVYAAIGLPWVPPELREGRAEFDPKFQARFDQLIQWSDITGDLHMHTHASDGENSIEEMVAAAREAGLQYIAITDHSKRVSVARGLDEERVLEQWEAIDALNAKLKKSFWVLKGIELDILEDGTLDLKDECLAHADWVTASIHFGQKQTREQITTRILNAIRNPWVHSISHPTGRLIGRRPPYDVDLAAVIQAAKEHGKCLELNSNPQRLDLNDVHLNMAAEAGVKIVINTDSHSTHHLSLMKYGILQARRAGLMPSQVLNTMSRAQIQKYLKKH